MNRVTLEVAQEHNVRIKGLKLHLKCKKCGRLWAMWFEDEADLQKNLPADWYKCASCNKKNIYS